MRNKILITGIDGNLGQTILPIISKSNYDYLGISRTRSYDNVIKCDITNFQQISKIILEFCPNIIIHLAGPGGNVECENNPKNATLVNVIGTLNILKVSNKIKSKIIFASTREVYGDSVKLITEKMRLKPKNLNGVTKMLAENLILSYSKQNKIPYVILRFTNFYGEKTTKQGISSMIKKALCSKTIIVFGGQQKIDFIHYNDAAEAVMRAIEYNNSGIFNIGSGKSITILSLIKKIEKIVKKKIFYEIQGYREFEVKNFHINVQKAREKLGFNPSISIEEGLKRFVV